MNSYIETDLYDLLYNKNIDSIIRYYNIIKKSLDNLDSVEIHQNVTEYENIYFSFPIQVRNDQLDRLIILDKYYNSTTEFTNDINNKFDLAYKKFNENTLSTDFTQYELDDLNSKIGIYLNKEHDHLYVRLAPYELEMINNEHYNYNELKKYLIERAISILNKDYFEDIKLKNEELYNSIVNESYLPSYNDLIAYSNKKYERVKFLEKETKQLSNE